MIYKVKLSFMSNVPKMISHSFNISILMSLSLSQDKTCFQNSEDILQEKSKCSMDSAVSWQKVQLGEATKPNR